MHESPGWVGMLRYHEVGASSHTASSLLGVTPLLRSLAKKQEPITCVKLTDSCWPLLGLLICIA